MCMFCRSLFVLFVLAIVMSVILRFTDSDYPFDIFIAFNSGSNVTTLFRNLQEVLSVQAFRIITWQHDNLHQKGCVFPPLRDTGGGVSLANLLSFLDLRILITPLISLNSSWPIPLSFLHSCYILLILFSSWQQLKYCLMDINQTSIIY
jgi:hypothetical protein